MDNPAYHPDSSTEPNIGAQNDCEVFTISRASLTTKPNLVPSISQDYLVPVNSKGSLFKKPKLYRTTTMILAIICILLSITLIIFIVLYCAGKILTRYCTTDECLRSAANFKYSLDLSVDPCEDFYTYTCGHWSTEHPNHGWYTSFSAFTAVNERIILASHSFLTSTDNATLPASQSRMLYQSCMDGESLDELGFTVLFNYLETVGLPKIPTLLSSISDDEKANFQMDWLRVEANIKKIFRKDIFFGFVVDVNPYNVSENVMYIGTPGNQCPLPSPFRGRKKEDEIVNERASENLDTDSDKTELKNLVRKNVAKYIIEQLIKNISSEAVSEDLIEQATFVINNMTNTINGLTENYTAERDAISSSYGFKQLQQEIDVFTDDNIKKKIPDFLTKYIGHLFEDIENVTVDFDGDLLYIVDGEKPYLFHIMSYLLDTSHIYIELYLWWTTVFAMIMNTTTEIIAHIARETEVLYPSAESTSRSRSVECVELVNKFMGLAVTYGIADRAFANKSGLQVKNMLDDIREAFKDSVERLSWMDKSTKEATLEKARNMFSFVGFPSWLFEEGKLEEYYQDLKINSTSFLQNMISLVERELPKSMRRLRENDKKEFPANPTDVNAFNSFTDNSIIVPLAFLTFPMYHLGLQVLNYGSIGSVLGHELTHGFDNNGRKHDKYGNYKQWWSNETIETFEIKANCFIKQYDNLTIPGVDGAVSGTRTLGENIADNGGLNNAFTAYKNHRRHFGPEPRLPGFENYTDNQLFFIAFGSIWCESASISDLEDQLETDVHCPNSLRVNMAVSNSEDFAKAFHCRLGAKLNPVEKCKIW